MCVCVGGGGGGGGQEEARNAIIVSRTEEQFLSQTVALITFHSTQITYTVDDGYKSKQPAATEKAEDGESHVVWWLSEAVRILNHCTRLGHYLASVKFCWRRWREGRLPVGN